MNIPWFFPASYFVVVVIEITLLNWRFKTFYFRMPSPNSSTSHMLKFSGESCSVVSGWMAGLLWHPVIAFPRIVSLKEGLIKCWIFLLFSPRQVLWFQLSRFSSIECSCCSKGKTAFSKTLSKSSQSILERCSLRGLDSPHTVPHWAPASVFSAGVYQHTSWFSHLLPSPGMQNLIDFSCSLCVSYLLT